jgi:hypothetical protein
VTTESKVFRLQIDADPRLAAGAGALAHFLGQVAGLTDGAAEELRKSVVAACTEAFENFEQPHAHLNLTFSWCVDRIEVALAQEGHAPALGLDRIAGFAAQMGKTAALSGIDRVQYETRDGVSITRLTKFLGHAPKIA